MAVSTSSYFSVAAGSPPQVAGAFDKFEMHATPKYVVGFKVETANGDIYRYSHFGADTGQGKVVSQDLSESSQVDLDNSVIAPASATAVSGESLKPGAIGSKYVQITIAGVTTGQFAGAKLITTDDTGEGYTYDIVNNLATGDHASGDVLFELAQTLQVALDATTDVSIRGSKYANLEAASTTDCVVVGVSAANMDVSSAAYGWVQTKGQVGILQDGTIAVGGVVTLSDGTAGAVQALGGGGTDVTDVISEPILGFCTDPGDSTGFGGFSINLE